MCHQESRLRKISFAAAFLLCILLSPFIAYFVISTFALRNPPGCDHCGNSKNEAEFCGLCGKNREGNLNAGVTHESR